MSGARSLPSHADDYGVGVPDSVTSSSRARTRAFLRRRLTDAVLVVAWLVVVFNCVQITRLEGESTTRLVLSYGAMLAIGVAATVLWWRSRRR